MALPIPTRDVCAGLSNVLPRFRKGLDQLYIIAHVALEQHTAGAPYDDGHWMQTEHKAPFFVNSAPINVAFYGGEAYIQCDESEHMLWRFQLTKGIDKDMLQYIAYKLYVMFRNMLAFGVPPSYLENVLHGQVTAVVSPFATTQEMHKLPVHMAKLVADKNVVRTYVRRSR